MMPACNTVISCFFILLIKPGVWPSNICAGLIDDKDSKDMADVQPNFTEHLFN